MTYTVTITDGRLIERHHRCTYLERNRLEDFAWRHGLRIIIAETDPRPERRSYR